MFNLGSDHNNQFKKHPKTAYKRQLGKYFQGHNSKKAKTKNDTNDTKERNCLHRDSQEKKCWIKILKKQWDKTYKNYNTEITEKGYWYKDFREWKRQ